MQEDVLFFCYLYFFLTMTFLFVTFLIAHTAHSPYYEMFFFYQV